MYVRLLKPPIAGNVIGGFKCLKLSLKYGVISLHFHTTTPPSNLGRHLAGTSTFPRSIRAQQMHHYGLLKSITTRPAISPRRSC